MTHFAPFRSVSAPTENADHPVLIYALVDPRDSTVRYVGQTENPKVRRAQHCVSASASNARVKDWVIKLHDAGAQPEMHGIVRCGRAEAEDEERYWIKFYRRLGHLYNTADGGKGAAADCRRCGSTVICAKCFERARVEKRRREQEEAREERREARLEGIGA